MPVARPESSVARVIAHLDMDCFYVRVECKNTILAELPFHCFQFSLNNDGQSGATQTAPFKGLAHCCGTVQLLERWGFDCCQL
ncbi:unnamed protein product [Camellia sinensis]